MLFYQFKFNLRGVKHPVPLFRLDKHLAKDSKLFWGLLGKMKTESELLEIKKLL